MLLHPILKRSIYLILLFLLFFSIVYIGFSYIFPFLLAILIAVCLRPIILTVMNVLRIPYILSCIIVLFFFIFFVFFLLGYILFEMFHGIVYLAEWLPTHSEAFIMMMTDSINEFIIPSIEKAGNWVNKLSPDHQVVIQEQLEDIGKSIAEFIGVWIETFLKALGSLIIRLPGHFTMLFFATLCTFFLCKDWDLFVYWIKKFIPYTFVSIVTSLTKELKKKLFQYTRAQIILLSINFLVILIALNLFQIPFALTISVFITLIDLLPIIGTGIILIPWGIYLLVNDSVTLSIGIFILYLLVILQRQLLEPKLVSSALGIHPLAFIIAIYIGIKALGFTGLWVGPFVLFILTASKEANIFNLIWNYIYYNQLPIKNDEK